MIANWYFDFVSPFAYLQSEQLASLGPRVSIRYRPVLFAGLLGANGQKGPAEIPSKRAFTYRFCLWQAKTLDVPLRFPPEHPFNPLPLLRLAIACDSTADAVHRIFRFVWRDGRLPDLPIEWAELAGSLGMHDADARIATAEVKDELRRNTDEAIARGVFGVPTLAIGDELFWGADATAMAADYVAAGCRFDDPEYARVAALPIGAARREAGGKPVRKP
jgi:2-hydroxychromene-2-carboxylate isomerase